MEQKVDQYAKSHVTAKWVGNSVFNTGRMKGILGRRFSVYVGELANGGRMPEQLMRASGLVVTAPIGLNIAQVPNDVFASSLMVLPTQLKAIFSHTEQPVAWNGRIVSSEKT